MKARPTNKRKSAKRQPKMLTSVARAVGSTLASIVATTGNLREKSRDIGAEANTLVRKTRKRISSATTRRTRPAKRKSR